MKRRFLDAPYDNRCTATVTLSDGSKAQCGRYRKRGLLCTQHAKMEGIGMYVIKRNDGAYVAKAGYRYSYVFSLENARKWPTCADAEREKCENERVVDLERELDRYRG